MGNAEAWRQNWSLPETRRRGGTVIALSGGGIRSATFSLGAIAALRDAGYWAEARYLFCVSGGGYAAGGIQLASTAAAGSSDATAADAFAPGTPEFDRLRRHSRYLADGPLEWVKALAVLLRGLLSAQFAFFLLTTVLGVGLGFIYHLVRVVYRTLPESMRTQEPAWQWAGWILASWLLLSLAKFFLENWPVRMKLVRGLFTVLYRIVAVVLAGYTLLVIALPYLGEWLSHIGSRSSKQVGGRTELSLLLVTSGTAASYLATVTAILAVVGKPVGMALRKRTQLQAAAKHVPAATLRWLMLVVGVVALVGGHAIWFLHLFNRVGAIHCTRLPTDSPPECPVHWPPTWQGWALVGLTIALLALVWWIDQTRWGLHLYYKKRLAVAFAARRTGMQADEMSFETWTRLDTFGKPATGGPQPVWIGAAHVSGPDLAPPGRRTLPYSMSCDAVGSPRLGWLETDRLCADAEHRPLRWDLTVQSAMAVSGAAFASAMGAMRTPFTLLFALTNARLGAWLPNPLRCKPPPGDRHRLPRSRTLRHLLCEIFGRYATNRKLLFVTDGGHYDNLGLIEALRHAPEKVLCIDGSGGATLSRSVLGPAIALARQELGIDITFDATSADPADDPRSLECPVAQVAGAPDDWRNRLQPSRIMGSAVLRATITYPDCRPPNAPRQGQLFFGRALLTEDTPWPVVAYASGHPTFPNDSTMDQWFDADQFDAYHLLGRHVGASLTRLAAQPRHP